MASVPTGGPAVKQYHSQIIHAGTKRTATTRVDLQSRLSRARVLAKSTFHAALIAAPLAIATPLLAAPQAQLPAENPDRLGRLIERLITDDELIGAEP